MLLYRIVLGVAPLWLDEVIGAKSPRRLPVVLSQGQVRSLLHELSVTMGLVASLLYCTGMRLLGSVNIKYLPILTVTLQ